MSCHWRSKLLPWRVPGTIWYTNIILYLHICTCVCLSSDVYIYIYSYFQETYVYMPTYKVRYSTQICICRKFAKHSHIDMVLGNICVYIYTNYIWPEPNLFPMTKV